MDTVLCGANAVNMKYYFNEQAYGKLPQQVKDELKILLVKYCSDVGGAITLSFDETGKLLIRTYEPIDEIGSGLKISRMQQEKAELFAQLELFAKTFPLLRTSPEV